MISFGEFGRYLPRNVIKVPSANLHQQVIKDPVRTCIFMPAKDELTDVEEEVYRLSVVNRLRQVEIAKRLNITQQSVSEALIRARSKLPPIDHEAMRRESLSLHQDIQRRALSLAERLGAPVTAGKDGDILYDPENKKVVRDYALRVAALKLASDSDKEIRKLHGLDAATKIEQSGTIRYEIAGVDTDALS